MNATGSVNTRANDFGVHNQAPPDESIKALKDHIGNRSVGGRFVSWVKNTGGLTAKDQNYHAVFQKALATKLGGQAEVQKLFDDIGFSTSKPLSARKIEQVMVEADKRVQSQQGLVKTPQTPPGPGATPGPTPLPSPSPTPVVGHSGLGSSQIASPPGVDEEHQVRLDLGSKLSHPTSPPPDLLQIDRSAPQVPTQDSPDIPLEQLERLDVGSQQSTVTTQPLVGGKVDAPTPGTVGQDQAMLDKEALKKDYQEKVDPGAKYSSSALNLRSGLEGQLEGDDMENFMAAHQILRALNLKENEEITPEHAALAQKLVQRYEDCRGTALYKELEQTEARFPAYFGSTFKDIVKNGWDPRVDLLATEELVALHTYTGGDYVKINKELQGVQPLTPFTQILTSVAVQGLNKLPEYTGMSVRGTDLPRNANRDCVPGAAIVNYGFTSTSAASGFKGTHQFVIKSSGGRDISFLSQYPKEKEILFPPARQFRVLDRTGEVEYSTDPNDSKPKNPGVATATITLV